MARRSKKSESGESLDEPTMAGQRNTWCPRLRWIQVGSPVDLGHQPGPQIPGNRFVLHGLVARGASDADWCVCVCWPKDNNFEGTCNCNKQSSLPGRMETSSMGAKGDG